MRAVTIVPLVPAAGQPEPHAPIVIPDPQPLAAAVGRIRPVEKQLLGDTCWTLGRQQTSLVEDALRELLAFPSLRVLHPHQPPSPPGPVDYPRWGQVYYRNERIAGERKRFVVVSRDDWNRAARGAVFVRTTSQIKRHESAFPHIQRGRAQADCGNPIAMLSGEVSLRDRPDPARLSLQDMVAIASGLADALDL